MTEFVAGWHIVQTLGEGAYGEVKLLLEQASGEAVAMKIVDLNSDPDTKELMRKEIGLHKMVNHKNVINFIGTRTEGDTQYIFLEYAAGGELFDRIEPDVGMKLIKAKKYFRDLICGLEYIHSLGIGHRDIKPENLLLDINDVLKITDFGLATLFRFKGQERMLERKCGTKPYLAPEVLGDSYRAEAADVWSAGVVLAAIVSGELPWDEPTENCKEFQNWVHKSADYMNHPPWNKMDMLTFSLVKKILTVSPGPRIKIAQIKSSSWFADLDRAEDKKSSAKRPFEEVQSGSTGSPVPKKSNTEFEIHSEETRLACSQPDPFTSYSDENTCPQGNIISFSQPANPEHLLLSTKLTEGTNMASGNQLQRQVKRMTRLMLEMSISKAVSKLEETFTKLHYIHKKNVSNLITVNTTDRRGTNLVFKVTILDMSSHILVDFRLSKGCGLDFKKKFLKIRERLMGDVVPGPVTWSHAVATNSLPT